MRYSLYHRFQGTLLGSLIGATIGQSQTSAPWWLSFSQDILQRLAQTGTLSPEDWSAIAISVPSDFLNTGELILGTLPLIVFFHDAPSLLQEQLTTLAIKWPVSLEQLGEMMGFSRLITLIFRENLQIKALVPQLLQDPDLSGSRFSQSLDQIDSFWHKESTLRQVTAHFTRSQPLEQSALTLGIYCFGRLPEDFAVGVLLATQTGSRVIAALTGALAGAYNSSMGIPTPWHLGVKATDSHPIIEQTLPHLWGMWTGVNGVGNLEETETTYSLNSHHIMAKSSSITLISQKEYLRPSPFSMINSTVGKEVND